MIRHPPDVHSFLSLVSLFHVSLFLSLQIGVILLRLPLVDCYIPSPLLSLSLKLNSGPLTVAAKTKRRSAARQYCLNHFQ